MLITKIKATQIQHLTDARYFAAWYVDWLGFALNAESESAVTPKQVQDMRAWLSGVAAVGEFGFSDTGEEIAAQAKNLELDAVELPYFYERAQAEIIHAEGCPIFKNIQLTDEAPQNQNWATLFAEAELWQPITELFIVHAHLLNADDYTQLAAFSAKFPTLLHYYQSAQDLMPLLERLPNLKGLQLVGGAEERVGLKSFDQLDEIFEQLQED
jgi:phosphoribosylanthranilate isomerase